MAVTIQLFSWLRSVLDLVALARALKQIDICDQQNKYNARANRVKVSKGCLRENADVKRCDGD